MCLLAIWMSERSKILLIKISSAFLSEQAMYQSYTDKNFWGQRLAQIFTWHELLPGQKRPQSQANGSHFFPRYKNNPDLKDALMFSSICKSSSVPGTKQVITNIKVNSTELTINLPM